MASKQQENVFVSRDELDLIVRLVRYRHALRISLNDDSAHHYLLISGMQHADKSHINKAEKLLKEDRGGRSASETPNETISLPKEAWDKLVELARDMLTSLNRSQNNTLLDSEERARATRYLGLPA
jgi:hypothetical protein